MDNPLGVWNHSKVKNPCPKTPANLNTVSITKDLTNKQRQELEARRSNYAPTPRVPNNIDFPITITSTSVTNTGVGGSSDGLTIHAQLPNHTALIQPIKPNVDIPVQPSNNLAQVAGTHKSSNNQPTNTKI